MFERYLEMLKEKGIKNIDVSRATGIPASTFSDWKKGKSSPKRDKIEKIANFFDINPDWLAGTSDIKIKLNSEKRQHLLLTGKNGSGKTQLLLKRCLVKRK
jgi:transcriptional regulator with XRE-family HTH domain